MVCGMADVFQCFLQNGRIEVGFLGGAQVDRWGNINTTVIGDYAHPKVRLPGSGGATEIAAHARRTHRHRQARSARVSREHVDFLTSPGHRCHGDRAASSICPAPGPVKVITDKACSRPTPNRGAGAVALYPAYGGRGAGRRRVAARVRTTLLEVSPPRRASWRCCATCSIPSDSSSGDDGMILFALAASLVVQQPAGYQAAGPRSGVPFDGTPGPLNAITDVAGVEVGQVTLISGSGPLVVGQGPVRTGVTAVLPRGARRDGDPVMAGWFTLNGNGEMTGTTWVEESGFLRGPVMITNTHSVGVVRDAVIEWLVQQGDSAIATGRCRSSPRPGTAC